MIILTVQFDKGSGTKYQELLSVFRGSVAKHMPEAEFVELVLSPPGRDKELGWNLTSNTYKLKKWVEFLNEAHDDVILADCDMLMLRSAEHAFNIDFDVAYTERCPGTKKPMNGGIMMARNNDKARDFFKLLQEINDKMYYEEHELMRAWQSKYPGMNQTAFMYILENNLYKCKLHNYTTREWNSCDNDWAHISHSTVFLHVKGMLRDAVLKKLPSYGFMKNAMNLWYEAAGHTELTKHATNLYGPMHRYSKIRAMMERNMKKKGEKSA
jgi:hypothetical protein